MKSIIAALSLIIGSQAMAHTIKGTLIKDQTVKTKTYIEGIEVKCEIDVGKITNYMIEDSFGNPAYKVSMDINVSGKGEDGRKIEYKAKRLLVNIHKDGEGTKVSDELYVTETEPKVSVTIAEAGPINKEGNGVVKSLTFPFEKKSFTCQF